MDFVRWCEKVNEIMKRKHGKSLADICSRELNTAWSHDDTPDEFVILLEDKLGLTL